MSKRFAIALAAAVGFALVPVSQATADHCSSPNRPYSGRGTSTQVLDWSYHVQTGGPDDPFGGVYYEDGYIFADGAGDKLTVRAFIPWNPGYVDVKVTVDPAAGDPVDICEHVREP